ncbi:MAG: hypothetical protein ABI882_06535, partial [Acidobacteriota bacterium]
KAIKPMYGEIARDFALIEVGYMSRLLTDVGRGLNLELSPRGARIDDELRETLGLAASQELLHRLVGMRGGGQ